jgi:TM2 domain-containing membrane protein YozV
MSTGPVQPIKNAGLAAVLSALWCGLGQIYNGQIGKGIAFMIIQFINALLMFIFIGFITYPIMWIWGMVDAYRQAEEINRETISDLED